MTHIWFALKSFLVAFAFLASSLIVRPMLSDPAPIKVQDPVEPETEIVQSADDVVLQPDLMSLLDASDLIVVGHIIERPEIKESAAYQEYFLVEVSVSLQGGSKKGERLDVAYAEVTDHEAFYLTFRNSAKEAIFFLQTDGDVYVPTEGTPGLIAIEDGQLRPSEAFQDQVDLPTNPKALAEWIKHQ